MICWHCAVHRLRRPPSIPPNDQSWHTAGPFHVPRRLVGIVLKIYAGDVARPPIVYTPHPPVRTQHQIRSTAKWMFKVLHCYQSTVVPLTPKKSSEQLVIPQNISHTDAHEEGAGWCSRSPSCRACMVTAQAHLETRYHCMKRRLGKLSIRQHGSHGALQTVNVNPASTPHMMTLSLCLQIPQGCCLLPHNRQAALLQSLPQGLQHLLAQNVVHSVGWDVGWNGWNGGVVVNDLVDKTLRSCTG